MNKLFALVPGPVLGVLAGALVLAIVLGLARAAVWFEQRGADRVQAKWDKAELERSAAEQETKREDARMGAQASQAHEADRQAMGEAVTRNRGVSRDDMRKPAKCGPTVGDAVVPGSLGLYLNQILRAGQAGPAASKPAD